MGEQGDRPALPYPPKAPKKSGRYCQGAIYRFFEVVFCIKALVKTRLNAPLEGQGGKDLGDRPQHRSRHYKAGVKEGEGERRAIANPALVVLL